MKTIIKIQFRSMTKFWVYLFLKGKQIILKIYLKTTKVFESEEEHF